MESTLLSASQGMVAASATTFTALIFLRAVWHKLSDYTGFTGFVADYRLVPEKAVEPAAMGLIAAEMITVALLVWPATRTVGAGLAIALLALYAGGMAINIARGRTQVECGCGGPAQPLSLTLLARNAVLALVALASGLPGGGLGLAEAGVSIISGFTAWLLYAGIEQLLANAGQMRLAGTPRTSPSRKN